VEQAKSARTWLGEEVSGQIETIKLGEYERR
jgi:hypothetical protein